MKKRVKSKSMLIGIVIIIFSFLLFFIPISHYGINWDEPQHFSRGYAYLYYFLTGKTNFNDIPKYPPFKGDSEFGNFRGAQEQLRYIQQHPEVADKSFRRSVYVYDSWNAEYYLENDSGHPPLNGILAALTNYVFFHKLGVLGDIESYHLFEILTGVLLVGVVYFFASRYWGIFAGIVSAASLMFYPLFLGEVHFNIKDPPEAAFYTLMVMSFVKGIIEKKWKWILLASVSAGFALGTKLNIIFSFFAVFPWLVVYLLPKSKGIKIKKFIRKNVLLISSLLLAPVITIFIFFVSWPYLWNNTITHLSSILFYYKDIGTNVHYQPKYLLDGGWNIYPITWIIYTTPPVILILSILGMIYSIINFRRDQNKTSFMFLLLFWIPILRVTLPGSSIYGGVRQIMEFIPGMALLSGLGALYIRNSLTNFLKIKKVKRQKILLLEKLVYFFTFLSFVPLLFTLIKLHPNENLYFNSLAGGLKGAKLKDIPSWGNSYGNLYLQGVEWINGNAPMNSKLALVSGTMINVPRVKLRPDIVFSNLSWSGVSRKGEYIMDMIYEGFPIKTYAYEYLKTYLQPVHEIKVDGVTVFSIWKNDVKHTKRGYLNEDGNIQIKNLQKDKKNRMLIELQDLVYLTRLDIWYDNKNCSALKEGFIEVSSNGEIWERMGETIPVLQVTMDVEPKDKRLVYLFAAKPARFIRVITDRPTSCIFKVEKINLKKLTDLNP